MGRCKNSLEMGHFLQYNTKLIYNTHSLKTLTFFIFSVSDYELRTSFDVSYGRHVAIRVLVALRRSNSKTGMDRQASNISDDIIGRRQCK